MAEYDSVRQRIIESVFSKLNTSGHQETYVSHVKIWEEVAPEEGGRKPRYIILASMYGNVIKYLLRHPNKSAFAQDPVMGADSFISRNRTRIARSPSARHGD